MLELLITNLVYVAYRLVITAHIVKFFNQYMHYYVAVIIAAQVSFAYDNGLFAMLFNATSVPDLIVLLTTDIIYTIRVLVAWWIIKVLWDKLTNYYLAVFIGAELTFVVDYFIFEGVY